MKKSDRIEALEAEVAILRARIAELEARPTWIVPPQPGPGSEPWVRPYPITCGGIGALYDTKTCPPTFNVSVSGDCDPNEVRRQIAARLAPGQ